MSTVVTTAPQAEPLSAAEVIEYLRESDDVSEQLTLVTMLIAMARQLAEQALGRYLITQTLTRYLDRFPREYHRRGGSLAPYEIQFPPIQSVDTVKYCDGNGVLQLLDPSQYQVDAASIPARLMPAFAVGSWPVARGMPNAVQIQFKAGYGADGTAVPACIKHWMLLHIKAAYDNRDMFEPGRPAMAQLPNEYVDNLIAPEIVPRWF